MKSSTFQIIVIACFAVFIILAVVLFATFKGGGRGDISKVTVWGTMEPPVFNAILNSTSLYNNKTMSVIYEKKDENTFDQDFVNALANGKGPDIFFLPQDSILKHKDKVFVIPYSSYSARTFEDTFVQEGELYLTPDGILGLPFLVDPLVMFWNRDIFSNASIPKPPTFWDQFYNLSSQLTKKDGALNITQSGVALGEAGNISNFKELLSALIMQAGSPIVEIPVGSLVLGSSLASNRSGLPVAPTEAALNFYTQFSNPAKDFYSWNRSLPSSLDYFLANNLGIYFGFASELSSIRNKNPNLNFDVASLPQSRDAKVKLTFARMTALAIPKLSKNIQGAFTVASILTGKDAIKELSSQTNLPPVRRDLLTAPASPDSAISVFYNSAIQSRAWLDPDSQKTKDIFSNMIESITSGKKGPNQAVETGDQELGNLFKSQ